MGEELNEEIDMRTEGGWVNNIVKDCIAERKSENRKYRGMRKTCGVDDMRTERQKVIYMRKKEEARQKLVWLYMFYMMVLRERINGWVE